MEAKISELTNSLPPTPADDIKRRIKDLEEKVEERTNRQLRKTLVFRGITENDSEKSWAETKKVLSSKIAALLNTSPDNAGSLVDRCHRSGRKGLGRPRPIFAAMKFWEDCESIVWSARKKKTVLVDYKYGPLTTKRRNVALQKRREMLDSGELVQAHVAYPARLMGKCVGERIYKLIEDFSSMDISSSQQ